MWGLFNGNNDEQSTADSKATSNNTSTNTSASGSTSNGGASKASSGESTFKKNTGKARKVVDLAAQVQEGAENAAEQINNMADYAESTGLPHAEQFAAKTRKFAETAGGMLEKTGTVVEFADDAVGVAEAVDNFKVPPTTPVGAAAYLAKEAGSEVIKLGAEKTGDIAMRTATHPNVQNAIEQKANELIQEAKVKLNAPAEITDPVSRTVVGFKNKMQEVQTELKDKNDQGINRYTRHIGVDINDIEDGAADRASRFILNRIASGASLEEVRTESREVLKQSVQKTEQNLNSSIKERDSQGANTKQMFQGMSEEFSLPPVGPTSQIAPTEVTPYEEMISPDGYRGSGLRGVGSPATKMANNLPDTGNIALDRIARDTDFMAEEVVADARTQAQIRA